MNIDESYPEDDSYCEEEVELNYLRSKPTCFFIIGKPGLGQDLIARKLAQEWKSELISPTYLLQQHIRQETEIGKKCTEILLRGESVSDNFVFEIMRNKLHSPEVEHRGYVLEGLPSIGGSVSLQEQLRMIKNLPLNPDYVIIPKISDADLLEKRIGQRIDCLSGDVYTRDVYDPIKPKKEPKEAKLLDEEEEMEEEQDRYDDEEEGMEGLGLDVTSRLVRRVEDMTESAGASIMSYNQNIMRLLEDFVAERDQQSVIQINASLGHDEVFLSLVHRLTYLSVPRAALVQRLHENEEDDLPEDMATDDLLRLMSGKDVVYPRWRWRRSKFLRNCPVALKDGNLLPGKPEFSVSFLDKMYCLSSEDALRQFMINPRPYLKDIRAPCKFCVVGPALSGKTSLCEALANHYGATVINMDEVIKPRYKETHAKHISDAMGEAESQAIQTVRAKLQTEYEKVLKEVEEENEKILNPDSEEEDAPEDEGESEKQKEDEEVNEDKSNEDDNENDKTEEDSKEEDITTSKEPVQKTLRQPPPPPEEVTSLHPEVVAMVAKVQTDTQKDEIQLPPEAWAEEVEKSVKIVEEERWQKTSSGPRNGGWILDNFPVTREQWTALLERNIIPDDIIVLTDSSKNGEFLLKRWYTLNQDQVDAGVLERVEQENRRLEEERKEKERLQEEKERIKLEQEEAKRLAGERRQQRIDDGEDEVEDEEEDDAPEGEESADENDDGKISEEEKKNTVKDEVQKGGEKSEVLDMIAPDCPEREAYLKAAVEWEKGWTSIRNLLTNSDLNVSDVQIEDASEKKLLEDSIKVGEHHFEPEAWEFGPQDMDEENEDAENAAALEEEEEEEDQEDDDEEEQEEEDPSRSKYKMLGDTSFYCPVTLKEKETLVLGQGDIVAKFKDKLYYFATEDARTEFLEDPRKYAGKKSPFEVPPVRIAMLGPLGSGKTSVGRSLAKELGVFHIQFKEYLQELVLAKTKRKVGPAYEEDHKAEDEEQEQIAAEKEEEILELQEHAALLNQTVVAFDGTIVHPPAEDEQEGQKQEENDTSNEEEQEIELTEEEDAIKGYLEGNDDTLPVNVLETFFDKFWNQEPFKSKGFVMEGFPRSTDDALYMQDKCFLPDCVVVLNIEETEVVSRLLPARMDAWRKRRDARLKRHLERKERRQKRREERIEKRRKELEDEREERRLEKAAIEEEEGGEEEGEEAEEEEESIDAILAEEFEEEQVEEEDEDETEEEAEERISNELTEHFESDMNALDITKSSVQSMPVPVIEVDGSRKPNIVFYTTKKKTLKFTENRNGLLERCHVVSEILADKLVNSGYKRMSKFKRWCPVKLFEGVCIPPLSSSVSLLCPVVYRQYVYYMADAQARESFINDPRKYIAQEPPKPLTSFRLSIVGPPKSGKTTLCERFVREYGVQRISAGVALRYVLDFLPRSHLSMEIQKYLTSGSTVPDELVIQAVEQALLQPLVQTRGYVLDGFPSTNAQRKLMFACGLLPARVIGLELSSKEACARAAKDRYAPDRAYLAHDSVQAMVVKLAAFRQEFVSLKTDFTELHQNWVPLMGEKSKWWLWDAADKIARNSVIIIQNYLDNINRGKAAGIGGLCITPTEFSQRLGEYENFCPVSLVARGELVDCSEQANMDLAAEFRGFYYRLESKDDFSTFLKNAEQFVPPDVKCILPEKQFRPFRCKASDVKASFPAQIELRGYCPVTFAEGKLRYEAIIPGNPELIAQYMGKLFYFASEEHLDMFMRFPKKYSDLILPSKLPPTREIVSASGIPVLGFLEQSVARALTGALTKVGKVKPKLPFMSATDSALLYIGCHLKAFNPKSSSSIQKKFKLKMEQMENNCELIAYLGSNMSSHYRDPRDRPLDFDVKMSQFVALKN